MEAYIENKTFLFVKTLNKNELKGIISGVSAREGVNRVSALPGSIDIEYNTYQISEEALAELIIELGYPVKDEKKKDGVFRRFIGYLARENRKAYGDSKLDCCGLNHCNT